MFDTTVVEPQQATDISITLSVTPPKKLMKQQSAATLPLSALEEQTGSLMLSRCQDQLIGTSTLFLWQGGQSVSCRTHPPLSSALSPQCKTHLPLGIVFIRRATKLHVTVLCAGAPHKRRAGATQVHAPDAQAHKYREIYRYLDEAGYTDGYMHPSDTTHTYSLSWRGCGCGSLCGHACACGCMKKCGAAAVLRFMTRHVLHSDERIDSWLRALLQ